MQLITINNKKRLLDLSDSSKYCHSIHSKQVGIQIPKCNFLTRTQNARPHNELFLVTARINMAGGVVFN